MRTLVYLFVAAGIAVFPRSAPAELHPDAGVTSFDFLKISHGAYYVAMGNAGVALGTDASAFYWNPANIALAKKKNLALSYQMYNIDLGFHFGYVDFVLPLPQQYVGAAFMQYCNYGSFPMTDNLGDSIGSFTAASLAGGVGAARAFGPLSLGLALKGIYYGIAEFSSRGLAADAGFNLQTPVPSLTVAGVLQNVGPNPSSFLPPEEGGLQFPLPSSLTAGLGWKIHGLDRSMLAFDLYKPFRDYLYYRAGLDLSLGNNLFVRLGYQMPHPELSHFFSTLFTTEKQATDADSLGTSYYRNHSRMFSLGLGLKRKNFKFDFAYTYMSDSFFSPLEMTLIFFFGP